MAQNVKVFVCLCVCKTKCKCLLKWVEKLEIASQECTAYLLLRTLSLLLIGPWFESHKVKVWFLMEIEVKKIRC